VTEVLIEHQRISDRCETMQGVTVVLENMSSVGNIVGGRPWHLRYIIDRVEDKSRIRFCIDTCHLFSSGGPPPSHPLLTTASLLRSLISARYAYCGQRYRWVMQLE